MSVSSVPEDGTAPVAAAVLARPHLIAIGGIGMSGLARISVARGARVSGSDAHDSAMLGSLRALGCTVYVGHAAEQVPDDASCVVVSSAIRPSNPELVAATERGLPVLHRAEMLAALMEGRRAVVVAGTHGKSSTTSMLAVAFQALGLDPSYAIGAELSGPGSNAQHGDGDLFVAEADESDRSFLHYRPSVAVLLNIEEDHHDHYNSLDEHIESYEAFARRIHPGGTLIACADDPRVRELIGRLPNPELNVVTYGAATDADVRIDRIDASATSSQVTVITPGAGTLTFNVAVPGVHMAHNAVAALAAAVASEVAPGAAAEALGRYEGIKRRFTTMGEQRGVLVIDSYAHHPTEVAADLATARTVAEARGGRVVAVFQPHLYTRTRALGADNGRALAAADLAVVLGIYGAREDPIPGVSHHLVVDAARQAGADVHDIEHFDKAPEVIAGLVRPGDVVLTMGAGNVTTLGPVVLDQVAHHAGEPPPL